MSLDIQIRNSKRTKAGRCYNISGKDYLLFMDSLAGQTRYRISAKSLVGCKVRGEKNFQLKNLFMKINLPG